MIDKNKVVSVTNRANGTVGYDIPDLQIRRSYQPGETKDVTVDELIKLSYLPGGEIILKELLVIKDPEVIEELFGQVEPEYFYSEEDIKELLLNGSLDQLKDCLDFAPEGVKDLVKDLAVKLEINDLAKREAISKAMNFNITRAIEINRESKIDTGVVEEKVSGRRAVPVTAAKERKAETPKIKIVK